MNPKPPNLITFALALAAALAAWVAMTALALAILGK